jgi:hypothetical protein
LLAAAAARYLVKFYEVQFLTSEKQEAKADVKWSD